MVNILWLIDNILHLILIFPTLSPILLCMAMLISGEEEGFGSCPKLLESKLTDLVSDSISGILPESTYPNIVD